MNAAARRAAFVVVSGLAAIACGDTADTRARATERSDSIAAAAAAQKREGVREPVALSRFDVPLEYDFTDLLLVVERAVPITFGSMEKKQLGDDKRKHYAYTATRGAFTAFARGRDVHLRATLNYIARGWYDPPIGPEMSAGCGNDKEQPQLVVELVTPLSLTPEWKLRSKARIVQVSAASDSAQHRCRVSFLNIDVTDRVIDAAREGIEKKLPEIDKRVGRIDLSKKAGGWWERLNRPIRLADGVWFMLNPAQLRFKSVTGERQVLTIRAGLDAYPEIITGEAPVPNLLPLPPLGNDTGQTGFRVMLQGILDYEFASRALSDEFRNRTITQGGRSVTIRLVEVSAAPAGRMALSVTFAGDANGTLRFVGVPKYEPGLARIVVSDLDYDLSSDSDLLNAYSWLKSSDLLATFQGKAQVSLAPVLDKSRDLIVKGLNRTIDSVMTLSATVDSVDVIGLDVTPAGLAVRARAFGDAHVSVHPKR